MILRWQISNKPRKKTPLSALSVNLTFCCNHIRSRCLLRTSLGGAHHPSRPWTALDPHTHGISRHLPRRGTSPHARSYKQADGMTLCPCSPLSVQHPPAHARKPYSPHGHAPGCNTHISRRIHHRRDIRRMHLRSIKGKYGVLPALSRPLNLPPPRRARRRRTTWPSRRCWSCPHCTRSSSSSACRPR